MDFVSCFGTAVTTQGFEHVTLIMQMDGTIKVNTTTQGVTGTALNPFTLAIDNYVISDEQKQYFAAPTATVDDYRKVIHKTETGLVADDFFIHTHLDFSNPANDSTSADCR
jgi:chemotaxis protein histidine kinase CheA